MEEPFVSKTLPPIMKQRLKDRCDMLREVGWRQQKFALDKKLPNLALGSPKNELDHKENILTTR